MKKVVVFLSIIFLFSNSSWPNAKVIGNGGDPLAFDFKTIAEKALTDIQAYNVQLDGVDTSYLLQILQMSKVLISDQPLYADSYGISQESVAINQKNPDRITLNRKKWSDLQDNEKKSLALHELLGLAGIEGTGDYHLSQRYADLLSSDAFQSSLEISQVDGASNFSYHDTAVNGGYIIGNHSCQYDTTSTCNSCIDGGSICNLHGVYPSLNLEIIADIKTDSISRLYAYKEINGHWYTTSMHETVFDGKVRFRLTWAELCYGFTGDGSCKKSFLGRQMTIGVVTENGETLATKKLTFNFEAIEKTSPTLSENKACSDGIESKYGLCHFQVVRGKDVAYLTEITQGSQYPQTPFGSIFSSVLVYYEKTSHLEDISVKSAHQEIQVAAGSMPSAIEDNRIFGITPQTPYCFRLANRDTVGNIYLMSSVIAPHSRYCIH